MNTHNMTQVSRYPLPKSLEHQMHTLFRRALTELRDEESVMYFLDDLLSPTEKIMLAKRLAIAMLLTKGYDQRSVQRIMRVSITTVTKVNFWLKNQGKGYMSVIGKIRKDEQWKGFLSELEASLLAVLRPPRSVNQVLYRSSKEEKPEDTLI